MRSGFSVDGKCVRDGARRERQECERKRERERALAPVVLGKVEGEREREREEREDDLNGGSSNGERTSSFLNKKTTKKELREREREGERDRDRERERPVYLISSRAERDEVESLTWLSCCWWCCEKKSPGPRLFPESEWLEQNLKLQFKIKI